MSLTLALFGSLAATPSFAATYTGRYDCTVVPASLYGTQLLGRDWEKKPAMTRAFFVMLNGTDAVVYRTEVAMNDSDDDYTFDAKIGHYELRGPGIALKSVLKVPPEMVAGTAPTATVSLENSWAPGERHGADYQCTRQKR